MVVALQGARGGTGGESDVADDWAQCISLGLNARGRGVAADKD